MPILKVQCPECEAKLRLNVEDGDDNEIECPKCGCEFSADLEDAEPSPKATKGKTSAGANGAPKTGNGKASKSGVTAKAAKRKYDGADEDDDEDDAPRRKTKRKAAESGSSKIVVAGVIAAVLALGGAGVLVFALTYKDKSPKSDDKPVAANAPAKPDTAPGANPPTATPPAGPSANPVPNTNPGANANPGPKPPGAPNPGPVPPQPPKKDEAELSTMIPPPPKVRMSGSVVPTEKPVVRAPAIPPLAPDEDPFVRAKDFKADGPLPALPALPPRAQRPLLTLEAGGHTDIIGKVFFTPKADQVITIARDKAVRIWDPATNEALKTIRFPAGPGQEGALQGAAISRTGKQLAVAGHPLEGVKRNKVPIYIITLDGSAPVKTLNVAASGVICMHYSNDGKWLAVGCEEGEIQIVDVAKGVTDTAPGSAGGPPVLEVKFNPNLSAKLKKLATLDAEHIVHLWSFPVQQGPKTIGIQSAGTPQALSWSNDGRTLAVGTSLGQIMLGTDDGQLIKTLPALKFNDKPVSIQQLQFMPGNGEIVVAGAAGAAGWAGIIDADSGAVRVTFKQHSNSIFALDVTPDGQRVVTSGGSQHETFVWEAADAKVVNRFIGGGNAVWTIGWAKDGKSIAWGHNNEKDKNREGKLEHTFRLDQLGLGDVPDPSKYSQLVTSDDKVKLLTGTRGFMVQTTGREPELMLLNEGEKIYAATVLPGRNAVAVAGTQTLALVNPATGREINKFVGHTGNVLCVTPSPDGKYFATGSSDQTIRIWRREHDEPVLSIFVAGRDWIAWTAQGYYACSAQGERLIAWQVGGGPGKVPLVHPAERFRASMYQPALLKYVVPTGDLQRAMAMAQKFDKALVQTTSVGDVLPPEVALEGFGETEVKVDKDSITVKATAKSGKHPITALRLLVNGRPYQGAAGVKRFETPQNAVEATWEVPLAPGTYTFAVIADSPVSKGMSKVGVAVRSGTVPKPNLYVLAVGVSAYPKGVPPLHFCASDAQMLANAFREKSASLFTKIEVKVLTDKAATKKNILEGMDWLKSKMTPQDVGIVTFSGHGTRDLFGNFYLCPADIDPTDEDCLSCLSGKLFKERLDNMPGRLVAILDACHSGVVAEKERPPVAADSLVRDLTAEDSGVIVMCASAGREFSYETPLIKAGLYTYGLVEGLSGHGDVDGDGLVYIHELDMYATARARQLSAGRQNPTLGRPTSVRPFPIAKVDKPVR
ncbi:caspase family protein [Frigoriglobus tundricola]|uniref:Peptidase C14 caspase domain-containing protein n=1 Tax=Frigoriglobus tundricola TaxID=2774151 RepID=A0A6M5YHC3_9BACT|nr:caspase family protein [Frigoriglobus tundricola]QJW92653.1 hypothetical protein FTUN_0150 [Frigoriglobus tundricola]